MNKKGRSRKFLICGSLIMVFIIIIIVIYMIFFHVGEKDIVVTVNGEGITAEELKQHMSQNKAYVITYFKEAYDAKVDYDFWNRQYEGTTPNEYLREYTLKQLVRYKVEQQLAVSYAFEKLDVPVVFADSILTNTRSQHVLEKVGFQFLYADDKKKYYRIQRNETTKRMG